MKIEEIKIDTKHMSEYKEQKNVKRNKEVRGGYENIIIASDQDLDWPSGQSKSIK